jgi:hypothetical protein
VLDLLFGGGMGKRGYWCVYMDEMVWFIGLGKSHKL